MAMLAEPRRRKRYNLNPRGKALYEDDTRFGTKMLEKMGWSKGKGLGANEDGSKDFVRVRFKNDAEGLGYETRDDQWTVHEEGFNGLLKSLNGGEVEKDNGNASASEEESRPMGFGFKAAPKAEDTPKTLKEKISGVSLEESSKSSKARVHYKKFTRGKDLSRYSEKDLANIFGKKATEATEAPVQVVQEPEEEKEVNPNFAGVQTLQTGLSVQDYFKQKMEAMKNRLKNGTVGTKPLLNEDNPAVETMAADENKEPVKKKKKRKDKELEIAEQNGEAVETQTQSTDDNNVDEPVKKKKNKKSKQQEDVMLETEPIEETTAKKEKKKKSKRATEEESTKLEEAALEQVEDENPPKRKKHKKNKAAEAEEPLPTPELPEATQDVEVKKKKKSKSKAAEEPMQLETEQVPAETEDMQVKKKKKSKNKSTVEEPQPEHHTESLPADSPKKSKKKSKKETEVSENVSCSGDNSDASTDEEAAAQFLSLEQLIEKRNLCDLYTISSFCAEKFHNVNMNAFEQSTLPKILGYGIDENVKLDIVETKNDATRIMDLWSNKVSKYRIQPQCLKKMKHSKFVTPTALRSLKRRRVFSCV